jgi:hypothetical protein
LSAHLAGFTTKLVTDQFGNFVVQVNARLYVRSFSVRKRAYSN